MKNVKKFIIFLAGCLILTGCGSQIPDLTPEQTETLTQYAAGVLLKYDKNYDSGIMSEEEMAELMRKQITSTPTPTPLPQSEDEKEASQGASDEIPEDLIGTGAEEPVDNRTIAELFAMEGIDISYIGYEITQSYPENDTDEWYFAMDAIEGDRLLVLKFRVTNETQEAREVDVLNLTPRFRIFINGGAQINAATTLLTDDLKTLKAALQPGESIDEVIIVEITDAEAQMFNQNAVLELLIKLQDDSLRIMLEDGQ